MSSPPHLLRRLRLRTDESHIQPDWKSPRCWGALALLVAAWFGIAPLESAIYRPLAQAFGLHMIQGGAMMLAPYAWLMMVRFIANFALLVAVCLILGRGAISMPLPDRKIHLHIFLGMSIGLLVMVAAIVCVLLSGAAHAASSVQPVSASILYGMGWLVFDLVGATGEEMYGRGAVLVVAAAFLGPRGAMIASGLTFLLIHLDNPGASWIWLLRLFVQGILLAWAVYRTGSLWWSVGYHTGWNWASAPLFGAAGSGYLDEGHIFDFKPAGNALIDGGAIGPEGSLFACLAVLAAWGLLIAATRTKSEAARPR